jgi:hypothetical protein
LIRELAVRISQTGAELYPVGERFFQEFTLRQVLLNAAKNGCMDAPRSATAFFDRPA